MISTNSKYLGFGLMVFCTFFTSIGQILWKFGVNSFTGSLFSIINVPFVLGCVAYGFGLILLLASLKYGELSVLYPVIATSYIWVSLLSSYLFQTDSMSLYKWVGIGFILISIALLGYKSEKMGGLSKLSGVKNG